MNKNKKIILWIGCSLVGYWLLRHTSIGYKIGNPLLKLVNGGVYRTGGGMLNYGTNHVSFDQKLLCERNSGLSYIDGQCICNANKYTVNEDVTINGKDFKEGEIVQGNFGTDFSGVSTIVIFNKDGTTINGTDGKSIEIPAGKVTFLSTTANANNARYGAPVIANSN